MKRMLAQIVGHFFVLDQISPAHVGGIELEAVRDHVEQALAHEIRLVAPRTAVGADRRFVGEHAENVAAIVFYPKRPAQHGRSGDGRNTAVGARVTAHVEKNLGVHRHDRAIILDTDLYPVFLLARLIHGFEVFRAVFEPANRFAEMPRGEGNQKIFRIELAARAEAAADFRLDEMNRALRQADQLGENAPVGVGHFRRTPQGQKTAPFIPLRDQAAVFQRHGRVALGGKFFFDDQVAAAEGRIDVADVDLKVGGDVVRRGVMELRRARLHGRARVGDGAEGFIVNVDQLQRILGDVAVLRDDHGDRIADVADFVRCQRCLLRALQAGYDSGAHGNGFHSRHIGRGQDAEDAGQFQRRRRIDFDDARVGVGAAQNRGVRHAGAVNIADVLADAAQKPDVFFALHS